MYKNCTKTHENAYVLMGLEPINQNNKANI